MLTLQKTYGELVNGDNVWIEGILFQVRDIRIVSASMDRVGEYGPGRPIVRFNGHVVDRSSSLARTGYDGGVYGGILSRPALIGIPNDVQCGSCGSWHRPDRSCGCFDNGCQ